MTALNYARYQSGLNARLLMGKNIVLREDITPVDAADLDNDTTLYALWSFFDEGQTKPIRLQICRICLKFKSVAEQQRLFDQLGDNPISEACRLLAIGSVFRAYTHDNLQLASGDYSIAALSSVATNPHVHLQAYQYTRQQVKTFMKSCGISAAHNSKSLQKYFSSFDVQIEELKDIQKISISLQQFKEQYWPVTGPDHISGLQALCDPLHAFSNSQLQQISTISEIWGLKNIFYKLCIFRALGGYTTEKTFLLNDPTYSWSNTISRPLADAVIAVLSEQNYEGYVRCTLGLDIFSFLIASSSNIALAARSKDIVVLKRQIAQIYQRDQQAVLFLDWGLVHRNFELPAAESDVYSIFIKSILLHQTISRRFLNIAIARGKGHLVADLSSLVTRIRTQSSAKRKERVNTEFIRRIRQLPKMAAAKLVEDVTDKGMMERLAFAFPTSINLPADSLPRVDNQASILRLELANLALRANVLTEKVANRIIEEETHFLRMHRFHTLFREGRVKIDWDFLRGLTEFVIEERFDFLLSERIERAVDKAVLQNIIKLFSEELSDILLFDSESSLEQSLNNNVRHGVLVPRFVKAFNEALAAAIDFEGHPGDLSDDTYDRFGRNSKHLLTLKEQATSKINTYKDFWLTVQRDGEFHQKTKKMITEVIETIGPDADRTQLSQEIIDRFEPQVDAVLKQALHAFLYSLKPEIAHVVSEARRKCRNSQSDNATAFLDILDTNINSAFEEVSDWLGLAKITTEVPNFELMDLIRFEAVSLIFSDFKKLHFKHGSYVRKNLKLFPLKKHPRIKGKYFEVIQEIVHNLISNALKHSGLGMNTEINMSVIAENSDLIFRCTNTYSKKNQIPIYESFPKVNKLIHTAPASQGKKDSLSGFSKIRNVCWRVLSEEITINIPPISPRGTNYTVEIKIPNVIGYMLA